jgi:hypothetical protein
VSVNFRLILADIIRGYTHVRKSEYGSFFIKHLNNFDIAEIDHVYSHSFEKARSKGIPTSEEKTHRLIKEGIWNFKDEEKLKDYKKTLSQYETNRSNVFLKSERKRWNQEINNIKSDIRKMEIKKSLLMGDTAESFASKNSNEEHIKISFYKDSQLTVPLFSNEEFNEFSNKEVMNIINEFKKYNEKFSSYNLKRVSMLPAYLNMFFLAPDDIYSFYGKPIVELSFYQLDIWGNAKRFQQDMQEFPNIPKDIQEDPDKLIEYVELNRNYKKKFPDAKDNEGGGGSIVGASKEDLETLGMKADTHFNLNEELAKKGGKLNKEDLLKLQGDL